jgi:uncharacterized membrane protein
MVRKLAPFVVGLFFIIVGITHFTSPDFFVSIVPPYLPAPLALVYVSGFFEILGGLGVLFPATRTLAGYGLLALLVAVYPANIHMAMNPGDFPDIPPAALYARLPFQFVFAWVVWWATRPPGRAGGL